VAARPIGVVELVAGQNSGAVEEVVDQAVDGYHVESHAAVVPTGIAGQKKAGQIHVSQLRADVGNGW